MADIEFFTVTGTYGALITDSEDDPGGEPDPGVVTGIVTFTPSVAEVASANTTPVRSILLRPIIGRIEEDGKLKILDSAPLYYEEGATRHPVPEGRPFWVDGVPIYYIADDDSHNEPPDGTPIYGVRLTANSEALGPLAELKYRVDFSKLRYDRGARELSAFSFLAPAADVTVDLATVPRLPA